MLLPVLGVKLRSVSDEEDWRLHGLEGEKGGGEEEEVGRARKGVGGPEDVGRSSPNTDLPENKGVSRSASSRAPYGTIRPTGTVCHHLS